MTENKSPQETSPSPAEESAKPEVKSSKAAKKEARMTEQNPFRTAMQTINTLLAEFPGALEIVKVKKTVEIDDSEQTRDAYSWVQKTKDITAARAEMKEVLSVAWQAGALNYDQIAHALRLQDISVRALLDEEFIEANGL